jgi:hypothetical protein
MGGIFLVLLGVGIGYIKNLNHTLREMYGLNMEHKIQIEQHSEQIKDIYDKVYKLNKAA